MKEDYYGYLGQQNTLVEALKQAEVSFATVGIPKIYHRKQLKVCVSERTSG